MKKTLISFILILCILSFTACSTATPEGGSSTVPEVGKPTQSTTDTDSTDTDSTDTTNTNINNPLFNPMLTSVDYFDTLDFYDNDTQETIHYLFHEPLRGGDKPLPLVIFLHGLGDSVTSSSLGTTTKMVNSLMDLENENEDYSTYALVPSTPLEHEGYWTNSQTMAFKTLILDIIKQYNIDANRIYISGISMGGFMTCEFVSLMPNTFAAAAPISGSRNLSSPTDAHNTAFRIYHVATDSIVSVETSRSLHRQLLYSNHPNVEYIEYPNGDHTSPMYSIFVYNHKEFFDWLFSQRLHN